MQTTPPGMLGAGKILVVALVLQEVASMPMQAAGVRCVVTWGWDFARCTGEPVVWRVHAFPAQRRAHQHTGGRTATMYHLQAVVGGMTIVGGVNGSSTDPHHLVRMGCVVV